MANTYSPPNVTVKGVNEMKRTLQRMSLTIPHVVGAALYQEALIEQKESMRRTPVDTTALRGSHHTTLPEIKLGGSISVQIEVGGSAAGYAVIVHEDLDAFHKVGQAKFLESTIKESQPFMLERIAKRVKVSEFLG